MAEWIIKYADGSEVSSDDVEHPRDAPARGVIWIWSKKGVGGKNRIVAARCAFFVWDDVEQQWYDSDYIGMIDRLLLRQDRCLVKLGQYIPDSDWELIRKEADLSDGKH